MGNIHKAIAIIPFIAAAAGISTLKNSKENVSFDNKGNDIEAIATTRNDINDTLYNSKIKELASDEKIAMECIQDNKTEREAMSILQGGVRCADLTRVQKVIAKVVKSCTALRGNLKKKEKPGVDLVELLLKKKQRDHRLLQGRAKVEKCLLPHINSSI